MSLFSRTRHVPETTPEQPAPDDAAVRWFKTLGGHTVVVTKNPNRSQYYPYVWECLGCGHVVVVGVAEHDAINAANGHAGRCRSMPKPETSR